MISGMERAGLAWNVVRITPERQQARALPASRPRRAAVGGD
jgi:hypothetical protein